MQVKYNELIQAYINQLTESGNADEVYKWECIINFQKHWNFEADDFYQMFKKSFKKKGNLIFQNSYGFLDKLGKYFPEDLKQLFLIVYNTEYNFIEKFKKAQSFCDDALEKVKVAAEKEKYKHQFDERTLSFLLAIKNPEKYFIYKWTVYEELCKYLNIDVQITENTSYNHFAEIGVDFVNEIKNSEELKALTKTFIPEGFPFNSDKLIFQDIVYNMLIIVPNLSKETKNKTIENATMENTLKQPLNQILFGPPGTGKTYNTINKAIAIANPSFDLTIDRKEIKEEFDRLIKEKQIVFTTFHQSMSYEDFVEGIKPVLDNGEGELSYEIKDGIFKDTCKKADNITNTNNFDEVYDTFINDISEIDSFELKTPMHKKPFTVEINSNKTCVATPKTNVGTRLSIIKEVIRKYVVSGEVLDWKPYTTAIGDYLKSNYNINETQKEEKNFVLIIDEINRGNVSQIFGELITLIEEDKRLGNKEALKVTLPYSKTEFGVPANLHIIGTMNTADRSIEALDTALRRRFTFEEMPPKPELIESNGALKETNGVLTLSNDEQVNLKKILKKINNRIEQLIDKDHKIGHSYFLKVDSEEKLKLTFKNNIIPLLEEYFYGDYGKIGLVLGSSFVVKKNENIKFSDFEYDTDIVEDLASKSVYKITDTSTWDFSKI